MQKHVEKKFGNWNKDKFKKSTSSGIEPGDVQEGSAGAATTAAPVVACADTVSAMDDERAPKRGPETLEPPPEPTMFGNISYALAASKKPRSPRV